MRLLYFVQAKTVCMYFLAGCVVSVCCVGFASLDVVCDDIYECAWNVGL